MNKLIDIMSEMVDMNDTLISNLVKLPPKEFNHYLPIVRKVVQENNKAIKRITDRIKSKQ